MDISALRSANFRVFLAGSVFSTNAMWMLRITIAWVAWDLTNSAGFVGFVAFLHFGPIVIAGPLFGVITDRVDVRRAALLTQSSLMALAFLLWAVSMSGGPDKVTLTIYATSVGLTAAAHGPVRMSLVPRLVDRSRISSVVNFTVINFNLARMTGPAIGGWVIGRFGIETATFIAVLLFLPILISLVLVDVRTREVPKIVPKTLSGAFSEGMREISGNATLREALFWTAVTAFFLRGGLEILPVIADGAFGKGATGLGTLISAAGVGAVVSGFWIAVRPSLPDGAKPKSARSFGLLGLASLVILGLANSWPSVLVFVACVSCFATATSILCQSAMQTSIDDHLRGRVMSSWAVVAGASSAIGAAALGVLTDVVGYNTAFLMSGTLPVAIFLAWNFAVRLRKTGNRHS
ncbi:MAG: MFS transporter [Paracoccaceae bacterium]|nr:MFS transporter [Paracoccaceae bacterium]MDE2914500.1 MFS transporter [Paracoccaceae bacterium]